MVNRNMASVPIWDQNQGLWVEERKEPERRQEGWLGELEVLPPSTTLLPSLPPSPPTTNPQLHDVRIHFGTHLS